MTPHGVLIESVFEGIGEYYSKELGVKIARNGRLNAERGQFNGGKPPLGYKLEVQDFGNYKKKVLVIDENTAPIVKKIFEMRATRTDIKIEETESSTKTLCNTYSKIRNT